MIINNLNFGVQAAVYECILAEPAARITNSHFVVIIPALMQGIVEKAETPDQPKTDPYGKQKLKTPKENMLNEDFTARDKNKMGEFTVATTILAENMTCYGHRLDGFIKHFHIQKMTAATGKIESDQGNLSGPTTPAGCGAHTHDTTGVHTRKKISQKELEWTDLNVYMSEGVDFENICNKVMKKGHIMYGMFVIGKENKFIITGISGVTPRTPAHTNLNGNNVEIKDDVLDGDKNPEEKEAK